MSKKGIISVLLSVCMLISVLMPQTAVWAADTEQNEEQTVIDVMQYGVDPSGAKDSMPGIMKAIEAAKQVEGPVTLNFPKGEYQIYPDKAFERELYVSNTVGTDQSYKMKKIGFLFEDMKDVTLEGNGSMFMFHGKMTTFSTIRSENIRIRNLSFDFYVPTVVDLTVESVDRNAKTAVVYVPECYNYSINGTTVTWRSDVSPYTGETYWTTTNSMNYTQIHYMKDGLTKRGGNHIFSNNRTSIEDMGNRRLKFTYSSMDSALAEGNCYQMRTTVRDTPGMFFWLSKDVVMEDVNAHFLHGFGIVGQHTENITLRNIIMETPEGSGRTTAGYADFIQISGCKGNILIEGCSFANPHDDPINVHGTYNEVVERIDDRTFKVRYMHGETAGFPNFFEGDTVQFMTRGTMAEVADGQAVVEEVSGPTGCGGAEESGTNSLTDIIIKLDRDMPAEITASRTHVVENITYTPNVTIRNNIFKETPTRGILATTRGKIVIEDNIFDGLNMSSISISNDAQGWYESGPVRDVTIQRNKFYRQNINLGSHNNVDAAPAVINIIPTNGTISRDFTVHENIKIYDNDFYIHNGEVVEAKSTKGLEIKNNRIYRFEPNVQVELTASKTTLQAGETADLKGNVTGNEHGSELYYINGCSNITISGNTYDDGLKLAATLQNGTTASDVTLGENENISLGGSGSVGVKKGTVSFESSNKEIVSVTAGGKMMALKSGTAKVRAYSVSGGRKFVSDWQEITVSAGSGETQVMPSAVTISGGSDTTDAYGEISYTASVAPAGANQTIQWSVRDAATNGQPECAEIDQTGKLTVSANGVVEVVATAVNGIEARKLLVINKGSKYPTLNIESRDDANWNITSDGKIQINAKRQGLWATQTANNIFSKVLDSADNAEVTVKMKGQTTGNYDEAGLLLFKDTDNYVFVGRKWRAGNIIRIMMVNEIDGTGEEGNGTDNISSDEIYFKLVKNGNRITGYYSADGQTWTERATFENAAVSSGLKVGFYAASGEDSGTSFIFSDLTVKTGNGAAEEIPLIMDNVKPSVSNVRTVYDDETGSLDAEYTFADSNEGDEEGSSLIKWMASAQENGTYELVTDMASLAGKYVKAVVIPQDSHGLYGDPVVSAAAVKAGDIAAGDDSSLPLAQSALETAVISGIGSFPQFSSTQRFYMTTASADQDTATASFAAKDDNAVLEISVNNKSYIKKEDKKNSVENLSLKLSSGQNTIKVRVIAEDGRTQSDYRFAVLRSGDINAELSSISINGTVVDPVSADGIVYDYKAEKGTSSVRLAATLSSKNASVTYTVNGESQEGKEVEIQLLPGMNDVVVCVKPETLVPCNYYHVMISVPKDDNTNLRSVSFDSKVSLDKEFTPSEIFYEGSATLSSVPFELKTEEETADIEVILKGETLETGTGTLTGNIPITKGSNKLYVKVTAPNGKVQKIYIFDIEGLQEKELSAVPYAAGSSNGWEGHDILMNKSVEGNAIRLLVDRETKTFESGIGGHAPMTLIYDLEGKGFTAFSAYIGVDQEVSASASITYEVYLDDELVKSSESVMTFETDADLIQLDNLAGKRTLKIVVDPNGSNSSDHVSLGDAKFLTGIQEATSNSYTIVYQADIPTGGRLTAKSGSEETANGFISVEENGSVTLTASANEGYDFAGWYDERNKLVTDEASLTLSEVAEDAVYTAKFKASITDADLEAAVDAAEKKDLSGYDTVKVQEYQKALEAVKALIGKDADPAKMKAALAALERAENNLNSSSNEPEDEEKDPNALKVNSVFEENGYTYKVTALNGKSGTVTVTAIKKEKKIVILPEVKKNGYTFKVTEIGASAYQGNKKKLTSVTIGANVTKIGKKAFFKCSKLKTIRFMGTTAPTIEKQALKGIKKTCKIQYPKKMNKKQLKKLKKAVKKGGAGSKVTYKKK